MKGWVRELKVERLVVRGYWLWVNLCQRISANITFLKTI